jgi:hypothetical protein
MEAVGSSETLFASTRLCGITLQKTILLILIAARIENPNN